MNEFPLNLIPHLDHILLVLEKHSKTDPAEFALAHQKENFPVPVSDIASQLDCYQRAEIKFPGIHKAGMLYTRQAIEQSTSEAALNYKTTLYNGKTAVDLTGGLGMDTLMLARKFAQVTYIEKDPVLCELARHNHRVLGLTNITHVNDDAESWLEKNTDSEFDLIYLDPSRRKDSKRVFLLKDCEPDLGLLYPFIDQMAKKLVVKVSPLYDLTQIQREIPYVTDCYVISVNRETKEILIESTPNDNNWLDESLVHIAVLDKNGQMRAQLARGLNEKPLCPTAAEPATYLLEPDSAIIKAGFTPVLGEMLGLSLLSPQTDYLTGDDVMPGFPGTAYEILDFFPYKPRQLKSYLRESGLTKVHIHKRDFPQSVSELYNRFSLSMGEQAHLFFTKDAAGELIVLVTTIENQE